MKLLEENIGEYLHDFWVDKDFLNVPQKALAIKEKIDKWDFIKMKNFCSSTDTIKRVIKQARDWGLLLAAAECGKGLLPKIHK